MDSSICVLRRLTAPWLVTGAALALLISQATVTPTSASAGTVTTWTGSGGNANWSTTGNWNPSVNQPTTSGVYSLWFGGTNQAVGSIVSTTNDVGLVTIDSLAFTNSGTLAAGQAAFVTISGGTLAFTSATVTTTSASGNPFTSNSDGDQISSAITLSGTSSITTGSLHNLSLRGNISGDGAVVFDDVLAGTTEFVYLSGSNSYTGGTQIRGGFVQTGARTTLTGSISNDFAFGSGAVTVSDNGTLLVRNNSIITNTLTISGSGNNGNSLTGSFGIAGATAEYRGPITVVGNTRFSTASSVGGDTTSKLLISAPVNLGSNTLTLRSGTTSGATTGLLIEITGTISGAGGLVIDGASAVSRVRIDSANSYGGGTTITTGSLTVGNASALGTGFLVVNTAGLDLNGQALSVGALSGSSSGVIESRVAGPASLTTSAPTDSQYLGTIHNGAGTVGLTKLGGGALTLSGSNSYTGVTNINGGTLVVDNVNALGGVGDVDFGGGTLRYTANNQVDYSSRIKDSSGAIAIDTNDQIITFANSLVSSNVGGLTKSGSGELYLNAVNAYTGATVVNAGTLGGNGTIPGSVTVNTGAVLAPGSAANTIGVLTVGSLALNTGATTQLAVSGTTAGTLYDQVAFTGGSKTLAYGGALDLTLSGSYADYTSFALFSGFTSQSGDLSSVLLSAIGSPYAGLTFTGPTAGVWQTNYNSSGQKLVFTQSTGVLQVVPEPSTIALAGIGLALAGWQSRRLRRRSRARHTAAADTMVAEAAAG